MCVIRRDFESFKPLTGFIAHLIFLNFPLIFYLSFFVQMEGLRMTKKYKKNISAKIFGVTCFMKDDENQERI